MINILYVHIRNVYFMYTLEMCCNNKKTILRHIKNSTSRI